MSINEPHVCAAPCRCGVNREKSFGDTADFAREEGEDTEVGSWVIGVTAWF